MIKEVYEVQTEVYEIQPVVEEEVLGRAEIPHQAFMALCGCLRVEMDDGWGVFAERLVTLTKRLSVGEGQSSKGYYVEKGEERLVDLLMDETGYQVEDPDEEKLRLTIDLAVLAIQQLQFLAMSTSSGTQETPGSGLSQTKQLERYLLYLATTAI